MLGLDRARRDDVGGNALGAEFFCERLRQSPVAVLRRRDVGAAIVAVDCVHAGEVDDPSPAGFNHARQAGARQPERGTHVDVQDFMPFCLVHLKKRLLGTDRGVVKEDIDTAEFGQRRFRQRLAGHARADVAHYDQRIDALALARLGDSLTRLLFAPPVDDNVETGIRQGQCACLADVLPGAGDQCRLAFVCHGVLTECSGRISCADASSYRSRVDREIKCACYRAAAFQWCGRFPVGCQRAPGWPGWRQAHPPRGLASGRRVAL